MPPLAALRAFDAAARHLSFTAAARELCVTQGAVSRQIRQLESFLRKRLFLRLTRHVELTAFGEEYFRAVGGALDELEHATDRLLAHGHTLITLSVLPTLAANWLMPRLALFAQTHPMIEVRMTTSIDPADLHSGGVDLAIRVGALPGKHYEKYRPRIDLEMVTNWRQVHAHLLFPDILVPICSRSYTDRSPPLDRPRDLGGHRLIHTASRKHAWPDWLRAHGCDPRFAEDGPHLGHFFMSMHAAREGAGVAIVPTVVLDQHAVPEELVTPFSASIPSAGEYYLLAHESRANQPPVRLLADWLVAHQSVPALASL
jgi:LysR family transcriptional regulator, glycine cleavage system transcriptional activator